MPRMGSFGGSSWYAFKSKGRLSTIWNALDKAAAIVLTNGNSTMATSGGGFAQDGARAVKSRSSGKYHFETYVLTNGVFGTFIGLSTAATDLDTSDPTLTATVIGAELKDTAANVSIEGVDVTGDVAGLYGPGTYAIEVDLSAKQIWIQKSGGARFGPFNYTLSAPLFPYGEVFTNTTTITINGGQAAWVIAPTAGFLPWAS